MTLKAAIARLLGLIQGPAGSIDPSNSKLASNDASASKPGTAVGAPPEVRVLPKKWEVLGDVAVLPPDAFVAPAEWSIALSSVLQLPLCAQHSSPVKLAQEPQHCVMCHVPLNAELLPSYRHALSSASAGLGTGVSLSLSAFIYHATAVVLGKQRLARHGPIKAGLKRESQVRGVRSHRGRVLLSAATRSRIELVFLI